VNAVTRCAIVLLSVALFSACAQTFDATTLGVPATLSSAAEKPPQGDRFRVTSSAIFGFWGIARLKEPSLRKALASQLVGGAAISNVKIRVRSRWSDVLVTALTAGLIVPRSVTFEGIVTK
jgi:hypothetical protein